MIATLSKGHPPLEERQAIGLGPDRMSVIWPLRTVNQSFDFDTGGCSAHAELSIGESTQGGHPIAIILATRYFRFLSKPSKPRLVAGFALASINQLATEYKDAWPRPKNTRCTHGQ